MVSQLSTLFFEAFFTQEGKFIYIGSFHAQSPKNCKDPLQILMKLGVFGVPMVLMTHVDF